MVTSKRDEHSGSLVKGLALSQHDAAQEETVARDDTRRLCEDCLCQALESISRGGWDAADGQNR